MIFINRVNKADSVTVITEKVNESIRGNGREIISLCAVYPRIECGDRLTELFVNNYLKSRCMAFVKKVKTKLKDDIVKKGITSSRLEDTVIADFSYTVTHNRDGLLSLYYDSSTFSLRDTQGTLYRESITFDIGRCKAVEWETMFPLFGRKAAVTKYVAEVLQKRPSDYFDDAVTLFEDGVNWLNFYINDGRLVLFFQYGVLCEKEKGIVCFELPTLGVKKRYRKLFSA